MINTNGRIDWPVPSRLEAGLRCGLVTGGTMPMSLPNGRLSEAGFGTKGNGASVVVLIAGWATAIVFGNTASCAANC